MKPQPQPNTARDIPLYGLYGEEAAVAGVLHLERIADRAHRHDWRIAPHRHHDLHQIVLIEEGEATLSADGMQRDLPPPAVVQVAPFVVHGFRFRAGTRGFVLSLVTAALPEVFAQPVPPLPGWGVAQAPGAITAVFAALWAEWSVPGAARALVLRGLALQAAGLTARALADEGTAASPHHSERPGGVLLSRLEDLASHHVGEGWRLRDYADALGVTPAHLNRLIRAATGLSASAWLEARLFREARRLLAYTPMSVAEVGYRLGFTDPAYFSRAFRRHVGQPPTAWRAGIGGTDLPESAWPGPVAVPTRAAPTSAARART
jgi:AraC family transcriptional regulator, transcriptional activator of pobA